MASAQPPEVVSMREIVTACPLNCWDTCTVLVTVRAGRPLRVRGHPDHPVTRGFVCRKMKYQVERALSPDRLLHPMVRAAAGWRRLSWGEALDRIAERMQRVINRWGTLAVAHYWDYGSMGHLHNLVRRFFNALGAITQPRGSLCWAQGLEAQRLDFGANRAHEPHDHVNSRLLILWGRNPAATNIHLLPYLKEARQRGAEIVLIDPRPSETRRWADWWIAPRPGTDGALALAMAREIIERDLMDAEYVTDHVRGFEEYHQVLRGYTVRWAAEVTGVSELDIRDLAYRYATTRPASLILGYGLQRYANSGSAVRAIDALGALTGQLGIPGGGVNYADLTVGESLDDLAGRPPAGGHRLLDKPQFARQMSRLDPPVKVLFVTRANPLGQLPATRQVWESFRGLVMMVVLELEMTDTARMADFVLPVTTFLEQRDLYYNSWHRWLTYGEAAMAPRGECRPDWWVFLKLADRLGLDLGLAGTPHEWIQRALRPLAIGAEPGTFLRMPGAESVPWREARFATPSGRFELASEEAVQAGTTAVPTYHPPASWRDEGLQVLSPVHRNSLHSQFFHRAAPHGLRVLMAAADAAQRGIQPGDWVRLEGRHGALRVRVEVSGELPRGVLVVHSGGHVHDGECVNLVTSDVLPDLGIGACYYDVRCQIVKEARPS